MKIVFSLVFVTFFVLHLGCARSFNTQEFQINKNKPERFTIDDEIVKDNATKLMWQKGTVTLKSWEEGNNYCATLNTGGFSDWRLPTINELRTLIKECPSSEIGGTCNVSDNCTDFIRCALVTNRPKNSTRECYCEQPKQGCYWDNDVWGNTCASLWTSVKADQAPTWHWNISFRTAFFGQGVYHKEGMTFKCTRDFQ
jgi:hypothetical protein